MKKIYPSAAAALEGIVKDGQLLAGQELELVWLSDCCQLAGTLLSATRRRT